MTWWLTNTSRAKKERIDIADLQETSEWLTDVSWKLDGSLKLSVEFDISHCGETFGLSMAYPSMFPDTPPIVVPRDTGQRLSSHQYGTGGELCLEFRPDNWDSRITGAMMIESAYRLLSGERPDRDDIGVVPSAHQASVGRDARGSHMRFVLEEEAIHILADLTVDTPTPITVCEYFDKPSFIASLVSIGEDDSLLWQRGLQSSQTSDIKGYAIRTKRDIARFQKNSGQFTEVLSTEFPELFDSLPEHPFQGFVLLGDSGSWAVLRLFTYKEKQSDLSYKVIVGPSVTGRLPTEYECLKQIRVGVVGCGSVGSKIASTLARSGIRQFTLVDEDIFFAANIVRNDLDANAIGLHKVDALATRLKQIAPNADISTRRIALGQQESAGTTESVMKDLARADLLIDATADPIAFNHLASVARRYSKPMVWCAVFSGGIGGIVARARPGLDPIPTIGRAQISAWCDDQGIPWSATDGIRYDAQQDEGPLLIADDADVSVISSHAARLAIDILTREQSIFPSSAYLIGLVGSWIFDAPFDTWPIELQVDGEWGETHDSSSEDDLSEFIASLIPVTSS